MRTCTAPLHGFVMQQSWKHALVFGGFVRIVTPKPLQIGLDEASGPRKTGRVWTVSP